MRTIQPDFQTSSSIKEFTPQLEAGAANERLEGIGNATTRQANEAFGEGGSRSEDLKKLWPKESVL